MPYPYYRIIADDDEQICHHQLRLIVSWSIAYVIGVRRKPSFARMGLRFSQKRSIIDTLKNYRQRRHQPCQWYENLRRRKSKPSNTSPKAHANWSKNSTTHSWPTMTWATTAKLIWKRARTG